MAERRKQPACGNLKPHAPHNGFASQDPEPWCHGVPTPVAEDSREDVRLAWGTAEVVPRPHGWWFRWEVRYFQAGQTSSDRKTLHRRKAKAEARAAWFAAHPTTVHPGR